MHVCSDAFLSIFFGVIYCVLVAIVLACADPVFVACVEVWVRVFMCMLCIVVHVSGHGI